MFDELVNRIKQALPANEVYILDSTNASQTLHHLDDATTVTNLDTAIQLPDEGKSCVIPGAQLPEDMANRFHGDILLATLSSKPQAICLLVTMNSSQDQQLLTTIINLLIENDSLIKSNATKEKKYQDYLREVKTIKEKLLPAEDHRIEGLDYATYYRPSVGGGGDHFDVVDLRPSRIRAGINNPPLIWGVGLMDVSGHGPGAAVEVAMLDAILRTYQYRQGTGPSDVLEYLNKYYFTREYRGGYTTGILCNYDASTDVFSYASAGHLPILIKHHEGHVTILESKTGIPIGIERDYQWETETTRLEQGDTIILYTDGITEAESLSGEHFGFERLQSVLEDSPAGSAEVLMSNFMDTYHQHISNSNEQDDQTLVMVTISS